MHALTHARTHSLTHPHTHSLTAGCPVQVRGADIPKPVKTWTQCGINVKVLEVLKKHGFERPLSIQAQVRLGPLGGGMLRHCGVLHYTTTMVVGTQDCIC